MKTDPQIQEAVEAAVRQAGQPGSLATLIVAWFDAVASGNEDMGSSDEDHRRLDLLYAKTDCESPPHSTAGPNDSDERTEHTENDRQS